MISKSASFRTATILSFLLFANLTYGQGVPGANRHSFFFKRKVQSITFQWLPGAMGEKHAAILIPVTLDGCSRRFFMQFDLGSPYSMFYRNKLQAIHAKYPRVADNDPIDGKLTDFSFKVDKSAVLVKEIALKQFDSTSIDWENSKAVEIIGTLGADLIDGRVFAIDYPNRALNIFDGIPEQLASKIVLSDFTYVQRRILLPSQIRGQETLLYFDTGSSMYPLLTDQKTAKFLAVDSLAVTRTQVSSWGKNLTANTLPTNDSILIGSKKLPIGTVTFIEGTQQTQVDQMRKMGIGGMTGNALFLKSLLLVDTKSKKFGLINK